MEVADCGESTTLPGICSDNSANDQPGRYPRRGATPARAGARHALPGISHDFADHRCAGVSEVREPAVHRIVQGARRLQQAGATQRCGKAPRRDRHERGQPRAGCGLSRASSGPARGDRDAALHARGESGAHAQLRSRSRAATATRWTRQGAMRCSWLQQQQLVFVHPYDDEAIVAGQGTVGIEMLQAVPELDTLVVAVGGGGLIAGIAVAAKALKPGIEIIGVQTLRFPNMFNAVKHAVAAPGRQHHRRRHRRRHAGQDHPGHHRKACGRHAAGGRRRHRASHRDAAGDRKDPGRGRGRCRAGGAAEASRSIPGPQGRPGAGRRKHRPAAAGGHHRTRHGSRRPAGARARERARCAGLAGAHHRHCQRSGRQHRRGPPPARLHRAGGAERGDRTGDPDPRTRAHTGGARRAA